MGRRRFVAGLTGVAGFIGGVVLAVPSGASAVAGPQFRAGQAIIGTEAALGDGEVLLDYPLAVASNNHDDGGIFVIADGAAPSVEVYSRGPASAGHFVGGGTSPNVTALRVEQSGPGGRGAQFRGDAAQVQLAPARTGHPKTGQRGDLFVDKDGHLWFCRGGRAWKLIA